MLKTSIRSYVLLLAGTAAMLTVLVTAPAVAQTACDGRWYRVQPGDSWSRLAARTALSVAALKAANPAAAGHPQGWLLVGQSLCLPVGAATPAAEAAPPSAFSVTVRRGDSWAVLAARYGVSVAALQAANPKAVRASQVLRPGDQISVPITTAMTAHIPCPGEMNGLPQAAAQVLTEWNGSIEVLQSYLARCGVLGEQRGSVQRMTLRAESVPEVVVAAVDADAGSPLGLVTVLGAGPLGWEPVYQSGLTADVTLLPVGDTDAPAGVPDINQDGYPDLVWSDTTCGANACFTTVHVLSYIDGNFRDWVNGSTTMASAAVRIEDVVPAGSGQELLLKGGVIGTVAAGPQRPATAVWASLGGAPYVEVQQGYAPSFCLYHHILDADVAMQSGAQDNYAAAIAAYRAAADDSRLVACWVRPNEVDELRAYALYRLAVAHAYAGDRQGADAAVEELSSRFPNDALAELARLWWLSYRTARDDVAACAVATTFAQRRPETWQRLADYGFANPGFSAEMLCPLEEQATTS